MKRNIYVPEGYRVLKIGEVIKETDAYGYKGCGPTGVTNLEAECPSSCLGAVVHERDGCYYYRKIVAKKPKYNEITIVVKGGMVQDVFSNDENVTVKVVDLDNQDGTVFEAENEADKLWELAGEKKCFIVA